MRLKVLVTTFSKSMAAIAVAAMVGGPAAAQEEGEFDVFWAGSRARANLSGSGCKADNRNNLDMLVEMSNASVTMDPDAADFLTGPNTGIWDSSIFLFGEEVDGEGTFVISKNGNTVLDAPKKAAMGPSDNFFLALVNIMAEYAALECSKLVAFDGDLCTVTRGDASWGRQGERLTMRMDMRCPYLDSNGRDKTVQLKINSGPLEFFNP
jgi:hypothetical protein